MTWDVARIAVTASWTATGLGLGLWLYSWLREKHPIRKMRLNDCGLVLVASAILLRIMAQERAMTVIDWVVAVLAPLFIVAALWRLSRTQTPPTSEGN